MKHKNNVIITILLFAIIFSYGVNNSLSQVTDYDGNTYKTVVIGTQEWMAENLNVEHYRNGAVIPQFRESDWTQYTIGAWCYYENKTSNGKTYGKLYNWHAVNDPRGLLPKGWHVPSDEEWKILTDYLGGELIAGKKLKSTSGWYADDNGTNSSGFTAFPGGYRNNVGDFFGIGWVGVFWSASEKYYNLAWTRHLSYATEGVIHFNLNKEDGLSIRCVRD